MGRQQPVIESTLEPYTSLPLECDGMSRVLTYLLHRAGVPHQAYTGSLTIKGRSMPVHFWLVLEDGRHIDYRARMWFGEHDHVPHGIFNPENYPEVTYEGEPVDLTVSDLIFQILVSSAERQTTP